MVLWQVLWERIEGAETQAVFRFIAPGLGGVAPEIATADLDWLCETHAAPVAGLTYARSDTVVLTLMDRPVPRGETDPEAVQFFGAYRIEDGACLPEEF